MRRSTRRLRFIVVSAVTLVAATLLTAGPVALAADPPAASRPTALPVPRSAERRQTIDVRRLPGGLNPLGTTHAQPLRRSPLVSTQPPTGAITPFAATAPVESSPTSEPAATSTGWDGFDFADSGFQPPDPWVAAGPDHIVQTVNTSIQIWDRTGAASQPAVSVGDDQFFALPTGYSSSDPRVIYDSLHGHWVATEVSWTCDSDGDLTYDDPVGYLDVLVSRTADPTGIWDLFPIGFDGYLPDYPSTGTSTDKLGFPANYFAMQPTSNCTSGMPYNSTLVLLADWSDAIASGKGDGSIDLDFYSPFENDGLDAADYLPFFTARVGLQAPATSSVLHVVSQHIVGGVAQPYYTKIAGTVAGTITFPYEKDLTTDPPNLVSAWTEPPAPVQNGGSTVTTAIDSRPTDAIWQDNAFTWVSTDGCTPAGDGSLRACVRVTQLDTSGSASTAPTLAQDFLIAENGAHDFFGGIGQAGNGTLHVVWTRSKNAAGGNPSSMTAYQLPTDAANSLSAPATLAAATGGAFTGGRWGDFVGVAQDPQVPNAVWQGNMYSTGGANWATKVSQLQTGGATYVPIEPLRVLDSRDNTGVTGKFTSSSPKSFQVAGVGTIPSDAIGVTGNVTVTSQTAAGYVSITTTSTSTPASSTINFPTGDTRANNVTTPVSASGRLSAVYKATSGKTTQIIFDVTGYFVAGTADAAYNTLDPVRVLDTRPATNVGLAGKFVSGTPRQLVIAGSNGIPADAVAVTANLTVTGQSKSGYVSITPTSDATPDTSNLNFPTGDTRANGLTAKLDTGGLWLVYKSTAGATTDVILDVTGYYKPAGAGLAFYPMNAGRIFDTRSGTLTGLTGKFTADVSRTLATTGHWGVPDGAEAVTGNLTVTGQSKSGYVSITPDPTTTPGTSTINFPKGDTRANGVTAPLNPSGDMALIYKAASGSTTHLILDLTGYFK